MPVHRRFRFARRFRSVGLDAVAGALRAHPGVLDAVVVAGTGPSPTVTAYVVPTEDAEIAADRGSESGPTVAAWQAVFDACYEMAGQDDTGTARYAGWTDSFTGGPIPAEEMAEWVDTTVRRIAGLRPRSVLEIGAGTGLLMKPLVDRLDIDEYTATDFSAESVRVLAALANRLRDRRPGTAIEVHRGGAVEPPPQPAHGGYDLVLLNSVVQYFPSTRYLEAVLRAVLPAVRTGGHIMLGDLRSQLLLHAFACLKHQRRAAEGTPAEQIAARVAKEVELDGELSLSPWYLHDLVGKISGITAVETAPRRGTAATEMTLFRYDAVLHVGCRGTGGSPDWEDGAGLTSAAFKRRVTDARAPFGIRGIANARLVEAHRLRHAYGLAADTGPVGPGADPEELCALAEQAGWGARLRWTPGGTLGEFDIWCTPPAAATGHLSLTAPRPAATCADPQRACSPRLEKTMKEDLLAWLSAELPAARVPENLIFVAELPQAPPAVVLGPGCGAGGRSPQRLGAKSTPIGLRGGGL